MNRALVLSTVLGGCLGSTLVALTGMDSSGSKCCQGNFLLSCSPADVALNNLGDSEIFLPPGITLFFKNNPGGNPNAYYYEGQDGSAVISLNPSGTGLHGHALTSTGDSYVLEYCGEDGHVWKQLDVANMPGDLGVPSPESGNHDASGESSSDNTTIVSYSIKIYYTQVVESSTPDMAGFLEQVLAETNQGYENSGIPMRIYMLCSEKFETTDDSSVSNYLDTFTASDTYANIRDGADTAALIVQNFAYCGVAWFDTIGTGKTLSITMKECATGYYSFAHEIGHNIGADHNTEVADNTAYPYGHGHLIAKGIASTGLRTIMGYSADGHSTRVNYWSNPAINHPDTQTPTGVSAVSNNAALLIKKRFLLAAVGNESSPTCGTPVTTMKPVTTASPPTSSCQYKNKQVTLKRVKRAKKVASPAKCAMMCKGKSGCKYWNWLKKGKVCDLLAISFKKKKNVVSGGVDC